MGQKKLGKWIEFSWNIGQMGGVLEYYVWKRIFFQQVQLSAYSVFLLWSIWPTHDHCPLLLRATMTTVYSCPSVCPPHSKHRDPFFNESIISIIPTTPPTPYPVHKATDYLAWQPFQCQPPSAFASMFCLICPSPRSVSQVSQVHFCLKAFKVSAHTGQ